MSETKCPAVKTVPATMRQFYFCDRPAGHDGEHRSTFPNGGIAASWPQATPGPMSERVGPVT